MDLPPHHLVTHAAVVGMTGCGKTGLLFVLVEEALRSGVPVLMVDLKGDLPNLLLSFPMGRAEPFLPWIDARAPQHQGRRPDVVASELVRDRDGGLRKFGITPDQVEAWRAGVRVRVLTPGSAAGEPVHLLSSVERRSPLWDTDLEGARDALSSAISLVLRLVGRDPDPARSKDHGCRALVNGRRRINLLLVALAFAAAVGACSDSRTRASEVPLVYNVVLSNLNPSGHAYVQDTTMDVSSGYSAGEAEHYSDLIPGLSEGAFEDLVAGSSREVPLPDSLGDGSIAVTFLGEETGPPEGDSSTALSVVGFDDRLRHAVVVSNVASPCACYFDPSPDCTTTCPSERLHALERSDQLWIELGYTVVWAGQF